MNVIGTMSKASPLLISSLALAQDPAAAQAEAPPDAFETVVVTASAGRTTEFRSSISVNSISVDEIAEYAPRGTAEIFRNIPGVRSEAGGGNAGNANIIVRGLPAASGG